jgi:pentatricopeptide repeat domain (PPR motif)
MVRHVKVGKICPSDKYIYVHLTNLCKSVYTYSACINAFAKSNEPDAPIQAEALLKGMKRSYEAGDMDVRPNVVNYNSVMNAWGRCKSAGAAERALHILNTMESEGVEPDALSYSLVVSAWAHSSHPNATKQAEVALLEMEKWAKAKNAAIDEAFDSGLSDHASSTPSSLPAIRVHLDVECYNTVLIALSKRQEKDAPDRAIVILRRMQYLANNGFETVRPNAKSWNSVLNALSRSSGNDSAERAEQLLHDMHKNGVKPDVFSYAAILHAYQKHPSPSAAERADNIVRQMEQQYFDGTLTTAPDVYHYTIVCSCWARSGQSIAAQRCWEILQHMKKRAEQGFTNCKPNVRTYNAVIDAYARGYHVEEAEKLLDEMIESYNQGDMNVKPDGFTFNSVINAWTRSRRRGCGKRAEMILKRLLEFHENGNRDVMPDSRSFSHIIDYYSRSREQDAGKKAEWLLIGMMKMYERGYRHVQPNIFTFVAVINTYAKSTSLDAGFHADRVLHLLEEFQTRKNIPSLIPNTFVMNAVLHAWSKSGHARAGERADEILSSMRSDLEAGKSHRAPNTRSYGLALATWAKSSFPNKAVRARQILNRMIQESENNDNVSMNVHCYNAVLNAVAFTEGDIATRTEAFHIASVTLDELIHSNHMEPTSSSFGTFIKACGKLSLPLNLVEPAAQKTFATCVSLGLVNDFVLTQMRYSLCDELYQKILGHVSSKKMSRSKQIVTMADIPNSWKRNVATAPCFDERGEWWKNEI